MTENRIVYYHQNNTPLIPQKLEKYNTIQFSNDFNQSIDNLPVNHTYYDEKRNITVEVMGIKYLYFGIEFNQSLDNLPLGVEEIYFDLHSVYDKSLDLLPYNLKVLHLGFKYNIPLNNLPIGLEEFRIPYFYKHSMINFPLNLKKIFIPIKLPNRTWAKHWSEISERYKNITKMYPC